MKSKKDLLNATFVYIPPGTFMMGSPDEEPGRYSDENLHEVTLTQGFYMQTTPVTQGQWKTVMGNNPSVYKGNDDLPVENVSWYDVQEFIRKLNELDEGGNTYRLPTEAEWEYACRAGSTTPFAFGECLSTDEANYDGEYPLDGCPDGEYRGKTIPVGSLKPNAWGLYDMHGNVWEWVQDWYGDYLPKEAEDDFLLASRYGIDPVGPESASERVFRGGSWGNSTRGCRSASRGRTEAGIRGGTTGFRLAKVTDPTGPERGTHRATRGGSGESSARDCRSSARFWLSPSVRSVALGFRLVNKTDPTGPSEGSFRVGRGGCWDNPSRFCRSAGRYRRSPNYRNDDLGFRIISVTDPTGPNKGSLRVNRGGSWNYYALSCRSASRDGYVPDTRRGFIGFRLAKTKENEEV